MTDILPQKRQPRQRPINHPRPTSIQRHEAVWIFFQGIIQELDVGIALQRRHPVPVERALLRLLDTLQIRQALGHRLRLEVRGFGGERIADGWRLCEECRHYLRANRGRLEAHGFPSRGRCSRSENRMGYLRRCSWCRFVACGLQVVVVDPGGSGSGCGRSRSRGCWPVVGKTDFSTLLARRGDDGHMGL